MSGLNSDNGNGGPNNVDGAKNSPTVTLEHRYIELLEKRIASLEHVPKLPMSQVSILPPNIQRGDDVINREADDNEEAHKRQQDFKCYQEESYEHRSYKSDTAATSGEASDLAESESLEENLTEKVQEQGRVRFREIRYTNGYIKTIDTSNHAEPMIEKKEEKKKYAFTWCRVCREKNKYIYTTAEIQCDTLATLLKATLGHHLAFPQHDTKISFRSPFQVFVHNWTRLLDVAEPCAGDNEKHSTVKEDLKQLLRLISTSTELTQYFQNFDPAKQAKTCSFKYLWAIFPPGCLVYTKSVMQNEQVLILQETETGESEDSKRSFRLTCWAYDWNGEKFNRVPYDFYIEYFDGTKSINTLDHYPLYYHAGIDKVRARLINRGKKYRDLCICKSGSQMFDYNGFTIEDQKGITRHDTGHRSLTDRSSVSVSGSGRQKLPTERAVSPKLRGHVIIDFFSYNQYVPGGGGRMGFMQPAIQYDDVGKNQEFNDEQYLICPPRVLGFFMVRKTWAQLLVEDVHYVEKNKSDAFNKLVLEPQQKTLIRSLVSRHGEVSEDRDGGSQQVEDIIEGKGKGVVILLHGPPGVGKSLTAESVAQITNKPLFAVSVADIGLRPADVEINLSQLFDLASLWKAVLLFDEADVFLDARDKNDMERNALVSVLLRVMEYYEGILILTTNRIKTFDVAVQSRVHLAVRYQDLSVEDRRKIFKNFYNQLTTENCDELRAIKQYIDDFDEELNGRQIRNVFSSAMALARERNEKVCLKDFRQVIKVTREFQKYLMEESVKARQRME